MKLESRVCREELSAKLRIQFRTRRSYSCRIRVSFSRYKSSKINVPSLKASIFCSKIIFVLLTRAVQIPVSVFNSERLYIRVHKLAKVVFLFCDLPKTYITHGHFIPASVIRLRVIPKIPLITKTLLYLGFTSIKFKAYCAASNSDRFLLISSL